MKPNESPEPGRTELSVVIVNHRSWPDVSRLVDSLLETRSPVEVIVVDNASPGPVPGTLRGHHDSRLRLVLNAENRGFSAGVNAGWRVAQGGWLLVLNPDVLPEPGWIDAAWGRIKGMTTQEGEQDHVGVVGFKLLNPDGTTQPSVGVYPSLARTAFEPLIPRHRRKYQPDRRVKAGPVDWVTGACMLVNAGLLAELGGMDEDFFLYYEEVALCRAAADHGWRVEYDPSIAIVHLRPLQNRAISPKMRVITRHSKLLYFRKHRSFSEFRRLCLVIRLEARLRAAWSRHRGRATEARAWRAVGEVARSMGDGVELAGRDVLTLAERVEEPGDEEEKVAADPPIKARPQGRSRRAGRPQSTERNRIEA